ncbi:MAG: FAD-dependent oxidoreductase [Alphaproteobacteria bacterium]|nr:FAD-dependent oxidoreductase [Alphaproteobacteria bacterium]
MVIEASGGGPRRVAVVGAGLAGIVCAERLTQAGLSVRLLDKGRGAGGRMSTRRIQTPLGEACFDHGATSFTAQDPVFRQYVEDWIRRGLAAPWPEAGPGAIVGLPTMNAPLKALAEGLNVEWSAQVMGLTRGASGWMLDILGRDTGSEGPFDVVVLAIPPEQASTLLARHAFDLAVYAAMAQSDAVWSTMVVFDGRVPLDAGRLGGCETLTLAVRETSKPGRSGPEAWTLQATGPWSRRNLGATSDEVAARMIAALTQRFEAPAPQVLALQAHRWRYARPARATSGPIWRERVGLGLCGDWVAGEGVEAAWRSGVRLADRITGRAHGAFEQDVATPAAS